MRDGGVYRKIGESFSFKMTFEQRREGRKRKSYHCEGDEHSLADQLNTSVLIQNEMTQNKSLKNISTSVGCFSSVCFCLFRLNQNGLSYC